MSTRRLLLVLTEGELVWDEALRDFDPGRSTAFPQALTGYFEEEPRFVDLRWARSETDLSIAHPQFLDAIADISAALHGRPKSDLVGDDVRLHQRATRVRLSAFAALLVLVSLFAAATVVAFRQRDRADRQGRLAQEQRVLAEGQRQLSEERRAAAEGQRDRDTLRRPTPQGTLADRLIAEDDDMNGLLVALDSMDLSESGDIVRPSATKISTIQRALEARLEMNVLVGHSEYVTTVGYSPDGKMILSGAGDGTIQLWTAAGESIGWLTEGDSRVDDMAFSSDGRTFAMIAAGIVKVWSFPNRRLKANLAIADKEKARHEWGSIDLSAEGRLAIWSTGDGDANLWDVPGNRNLRHFSLPNDAVVQVALSPTGRFLATSHRTDDRVAIWRADGTIVRRLGVHRGSSGAIAWSPDGRLLAMAESDMTASVWDAESGTHVSSLRGHAERILALAFSPDGKSLATASLDRTVRLWYPRSGVEFALLRGHGGAVTAVAFSPDSHSLVSGSIDTTVRVWNATGASAPRPTVVASPVTSFDLDWPNDQAALGHADGTVSVVKIHNGITSRTHKVSSEAIHLIRFVSSGSRLLMASQDGSTEVMNVQTGIATPLGRAGDHPWIKLATSRNSSSFLVVDKSGTATIWNSDLVTHTSIEAMAPEFTADGFVGPHGVLLLRCESEDDYCHVSKVGSPDVRFDIYPPNSSNVPDRRVNSSVFSSDGSLLAVGYSAKFTTWDVIRGKLLFGIPRTEAKSIVTSSFSHDNSRLLTTYDDFSADVRDVRTGALRGVFTGHHGTIVDQELNKDGSEALTVSRDGMLRLTDIATGRALHVIQIPGLQAARLVPDSSEILLIRSSGALELFHRHVSLSDLDRAIHRCLTPLERKTFGLRRQPPRWCITGLGRAHLSDPKTWIGLWPYRSKDWQQWLLLGAKGPLPLAEGEDEDPPDFETIGP